METRLYKFSTNKSKAARNREVCVCIVINGLLFESPCKHKHCYLHHYPRGRAGAGQPLAPERAQNVKMLAVSLPS